MVDRSVWYDFAKSYFLNGMPFPSEKINHVRDSHKRRRRHSVPCPKPSASADWLREKLKRNQGDVSITSSAISHQQMASGKFPPSGSSASISFESRQHLITAKRRRYSSPSALYMLILFAGTGSKVSSEWMFQSSRLMCYDRRARIVWVEINVKTMNRQLSVLRVCVGLVLLAYNKRLDHYLKRCRAWNCKGIPLPSAYFMISLCASFGCLLKYALWKSASVPNEH